MEIIGILLGLLPGFVWLIFYLKEDLHPEPKRLIFLTFLAGAASAFFALFFQDFLVSWGCLAGSSVLIPCGALGGSIPLTPIVIIIFALVEEVFKFGAAYLAVKRSAAFDEPVDAMIYAIVAALGFATVENIGAITFGHGAQAAILSDLFEITSLRFVGATLLHTLASALAGYWWAVSIREFGAKRFIVWGLLVATGLHALFNYFILEFQGMVLPVALLLIAGFFVLNDFEKLRRKPV